MIKKHTNCIPPNVKNKINKRRRLIAIDRRNKNSAHFDTIKILTSEIRLHLTTSKREAIQRVAMGTTGGGGDIWKAVKMAKNVNQNSLPPNLTLGGVPVATREIANAFGKFFSTKVNTLLANSKIERGVYNGKNKLIVQNRNFMTKIDIRECIYSIKSKRCEGYDLIPVTTICDARDVLLEPYTVLFDRIYYSGKLP